MPIMLLAGTQVTPAEAVVLGAALRAAATPCPGIGGGSWVRPLAARMPRAIGQYAVVSIDFEEARQLWHQHASAPWPESVARGTEYGGVDVVALDADASGLASSVVQGRRPPSGEQLRLLHAVESDLRLVIESVPESAKPYFEHLLRLVRAVAA